MVVKSHSNNSKTNYTFLRKAGRSIIDRRPVFSPDGDSVLIAVENIVRVYNIQTGDCARTLEQETSVDDIVAIQFPDKENYYLYGCSVAGYLTTWTWENGAVLRETNLPIPDDFKVVTFNLVNDNECFITASGPFTGSLYQALYSVKTGDLIYEFRGHQIPYHEHMIRVDIGWCSGDRFAAITNGTPVLYIQNLNQPHISAFFTNANRIRIISVSTHPMESTLVITDALGRATIYRGNLYNFPQVGKEVLHWHILPAMTACFSTQGSYLYTGGIERVLVKWTLGTLANKANEREFIPRLPGMIRFITTNNSHIAITLSNNSVVIANAQMRVFSTILECGGLSPVARCLTTPLLYHQRLGGLLMGGRTGHLQLYSVATDKVLYNIDITGMNPTPPERYNLIPAETEVTCAAVSGDSNWLATSEYRNDSISYPEERLKFWHLQIKDAIPFKLNTCVNLSHGGCMVISLAFNRNGDICVSVGTDQKFRIWRKMKPPSGRREYSWVCLTACYYSSGIAQFLSQDILNQCKTGCTPPGKDTKYPYFSEITENDVIQRLLNIHKEHYMTEIRPGEISKVDENEMNGVAISTDGSLIAAWFGCKLTLWDSYLCNLRTSLSHPALRPKGIHVKFGNYDASHYLVCSTETCVAVWSLLSLTVKWLVHIHSTCLAADPFSNKMALTTTDNDVYIFTPHSSTPTLIKKRLLDPNTGVFKQCCFGYSQDDVKLYIMRNDSEVYCLEPEKSDVGSLEVISHRKLPASNFSALLAEQHLSEVKPARFGDTVQLDTNALGNTAIAQFLSAAPHMMPPVSLLCTSFLHHLSGQQLSEADEEQEEVIMDLDQSSSDDEDNERKLDGPYAPKTAQLWTPNYEKVKEKRLIKIAQEPLLDLHATESIFGV